MKKSLLIASILVLAIGCPLLAQDTETNKAPVVEKLTFQQSLQRDRSVVQSQTLGEALRGPGLERGRKPLIIVDGVISKGEGKDPMDTKVSDILTISVVKDPANLVMYGPEGANGVILVTTKRANLK